MAETERVTESFAASELMAEATVDEAGVIRNVLLCGNLSANGYSIPPKAFGDESRTKTLYEGKLVFLNHVRGSAAPLDRSVEEIAGHVESVRLVNGRPVADIVTEGYAKGTVLAGLAKHRRYGIGMSHCAGYRMSKDRKCVESVEHVFSVDVVVNPATTNNFKENTKGGEMSLELLEGQLKDLRKDLDAVKAEKTALETQVKSLETEKTKLSGDLHVSQESLKTAQDNLDVLEAAKALSERRECVAGELKASGLSLDDKAVCSDYFVESLVSEPSTEKRKTAIEDRKKLLGAGKGTSERKGSESKAFDPEAWHNSAK